MNYQQRQLANAAFFLGPATLLLLMFFLAPIIVDLYIAFSDMGRNLKVTEWPTLENFNKMVKVDAEALLGFEMRGQFYRALLKTFTYVFFTLVFFNVSFALILALATTALPDRLGGFFRSVWLLPRMSPSVVYALLWAWVIDPTRGLLSQVFALVGLEPVNLKLDSPMLLIVIANGLIGASLGMIIFTSAIRSIPEHLFHAARTDGASPLGIARHIILPALRWPLSYITMYQTLALLVSFEYIFLIMRDSRQTMVYANLVYTRSLAPDVGT